MPVNIAWTIGLVLLSCFGFYLIIRFELLTFLYDMRAGETGLDFYMFKKLNFKTIPYGNIEYVFKLKGKGNRYLAVNYKNRPFAVVFLIHKKKAFYSKDELVTPSDPEKFIASLRSNAVIVKIET